jgi:molecular chaperone GrpE
MSKMSSQSPIEERPELSVKLFELDILRQSVDEAKAKEKSLYDQLLRFGAEFENYRKRAEQRVVDSRKAGREDVLLDVIQLGDGLIQAVSSSRNTNDIEALKTGLSLVLTQFEKFMKDHGVEPIKALGEKLDPHQHEVLLQQEAEDGDDGVILDEIQRGYTFQGRVLRASKVKVAVRKKPETVEAENNQTNL